MSHCAVCCNKQFVANGCQVPVPSESGGAVACGETQTLDLISQIRQEFENKMQQIDTEAGGDCMSGLQAKLHLQEEWIRSLTIQNEMLVKAVKELETEAIRRVSKSEEKLESSCHVGSESSVESNKVPALEDEAKEEELSAKSQKESHESIQKSIEEKLSDMTNTSTFSKRDTDCAAALKRAEELEKELEKALQESENERKKRSQEISNLKETIFELERALQNAQTQGESLQKLDCSVLKNEIAKLKAENEHQCNLNMAFSQKLVAKEAELKEASKVSVECEELQQSIVELQQANEELQKSLNQSKEQLHQETRISQIDCERAEELAHSLQKVSEELVRTQQKCCCAEKKLGVALSENNELQNEVSVLMNRIACYEQQTVLSEERTEYCQGEIENCNKNLHCLNEKLTIMKDLLRQKDEQYSQLETYYFVQTNALECSKKACEETKAHYESDIEDLKCTIHSLNEKLIKAEDNYHSLHEDFKKSQLLVVEASHRESQMQQDYVRCSKELTDKVQASEAEEARVREFARQVEAQNSVLRNDLMTLQRQIELLKAQVTRLKSAAAAQMKTAQEEINALKNELNKIIQQHSKVKSENDSLRLQISHIQAYEQQNRVTGEQLDQCLRELHTVQAEKQRLEVMNQKFVKEFKSLREAYKNMDRDHQRLSQSVINVEQDLAVTKNSRDELCVESRNVINNVERWLQYQTKINDQLKLQLRDNNLLINNLEQEILYLQTENNNSCPCKERQRGGSSRHTTNIPASQHKLFMNPEIHGLPTPSSTFSNSTNDWYTYTDSDEESVQEADLPQLWVRKVESITQELQKSNEFWRSQMLENDYMVTRDQ